MEAERGEEQLAWGAAGSAACLCPAAVAAAGAQAAGSLSPRRHALEQEMLRRADLQLLQGANNGGGDRRRERRMKNRESAARSRARRYAYVNELEKEVSLLRAENDELRKLCQELKEAALAPAPVKKAPNNPQPQRLQRTSSAPF